MLDLQTPEPPIDPPEPREEHGHWFYGEWIDDDAREWEPDYDDTDQCHGYVPFCLKDNPGTIDGVQYREIPEGMAK